MQYPHDDVKLLAHVTQESRTYNDKEYWRCNVFWWKATQSKPYGCASHTRWHYDIENETPGDLFEWSDYIPKPPKETGVYYFEGIAEGGGTDYFGEADDIYYVGVWYKITWPKAAMIAMGKQVCLQP